MYPILLALGPIKVYSYGVMLFIGFFFSLFIVWKRGLELRFDEESLFNSTFTILFISLLAGRFGFIATHASEFGLDTWKWLNVFGAYGFSTLAGLSGFLLGIYWQSKKQKWDFYNLGDVLVVALVMGQIFTSLGGFLNGNNYGAATNLPIGVTYPGMFDKRHPTQIYSAILYVALFYFLWWLEGVYRTFSWYKGARSQAKPGFITAVYIISMGIINFLLSFTKDSGIIALGINLEPLIFLTVSFAGVFLLLYRAGGNTSRSNGLEKLWEQILQNKSSNK